MLLRFALISAILVTGSVLIAQDTASEEETAANTTTRSILTALGGGDENDRATKDPRANVADFFNAAAGAFAGESTNAATADPRDDRAIQQFLAAGATEQALTYLQAADSGRVRACYLHIDGKKLLICDDEGETLAALDILDHGSVVIPSGWLFTGPSKAKSPAKRRVIGIQTGALDPALRRHLSLGENEGILVSSVVSGQPAEEAGVRAHDVIIAVDGQSPATLEGLRRHLSGDPKKSRVLLTIVRGGKTIQIASGVAEIASAEPNPGLRGNFAFSTDGDSGPTLYWDRAAGNFAATNSMNIESIQKSDRGTTVTGVVVDPEGKPIGRNVIQLESSGDLVDPEARKYLQGEMDKFLSGEAFDQAEGYVPPSDSGA